MRPVGTHCAPPLQSSVDGDGKDTPKAAQESEAEAGEEEELAGSEDGKSLGEFGQRVQTHALKTHEQRIAYQEYASNTPVIGIQEVDVQELSADGVQLQVRV